MFNKKKSLKNGVRPADILINKNKEGLRKSFVLVGLNQVKIWQVLLVVVFFVGAMSALIWAGLGEKFINSWAAPGDNITNQAQAQYQDVLGNSYGPVNSNNVVVTEE